MAVSQNRVLVTGAGGFIGSHLVECLVRRGDVVRCFVRYNSRGDYGHLDLLPKDIQGHLEIIQGDLRDPDLAGCSITILEIRVTPDLRTATAYVSSLGGGDMQRVISGLNRAAPYLNGRVARSVRLRNTPRFYFLADPSFEKASRIEALLRQPRITRDLAGVKTSDQH